jgi:hypothetical protein
MQDVVRDGMAAGALGLSVSREKGHFDPQGVPSRHCRPTNREIFALRRRAATWRPARSSRRRPYVELKDGMMRRLAEQAAASSTTACRKTMRRPNEWKEHMARIEDRGDGHPRLSDVQPEPGHARFHDEEYPGIPGLPTGTRSC